ncbi:MAG TPA: hypothetical protein VN043_10025 [Rhodanobacter sp.]|nr:hypothetical protein [Rhodanobacter sp.]
MAAPSSVILLINISAPAEGLGVAVEVRMQVIDSKALNTVVL